MQAAKEIIMRSMLLKWDNMDPCDVDGVHDRPERNEVQNYSDPKSSR
jgi:hypothetical protein